MHVVIVAELVDPDNISNVTFSSNVNSIFISGSYIQQRSRRTGKQAFLLNTATYVHTYVVKNNNIMISVIDDYFR